MITGIFSNLPFTVCLFWTLIFTLEYKKNNSAQKLLTWFMGVCTLLYFSHAAFFYRNVYLFSILESLYAFCTLAVYPLYYLYICQLTDDKPLKLKNFIVILPAVLISIASIVLYILMGDQRINYVDSHLFHPRQSFIDITFYARAQSLRLFIMKLVFAIQLIPVSYYGFKRLSDFNAKIRNYYSDTDGKVLSKISSLLIVFIIFAFISGLANQIGRAFFIQNHWLVFFPSVVFSCLIFGVGYLGYKQKFTAADFHKDELTEESNESLSDKDDYQESNPLFINITRVIEDKELYLQKGVKISDIAREVGTNRTYISNYINHEFNQSFSDYINSYRIKNAEKYLMSKENQYSMLEISNLSGFTNEASFYRTFKKFTHKTPSEWRKEKI